jgi:hypothetical protein
MEYAPLMRPRHADTRYLELHRGKWRVTVAVPRPLVHKLGTRLKRPLNTDSRATANALKWAVVAELKAIIDRTAHDSPKPDNGAHEALAIAAHRAVLRDPRTWRSWTMRSRAGLRRCWAIPSPR